MQSLQTVTITSNTGVSCSSQFGKYINSNRAKFILMALLKSPRQNITLVFFFSMVDQTFLLAIHGITILRSPTAGGSFLPCIPKNYQVSILFLLRLGQSPSLAGLRMNLPPQLFCSKDCFSFRLCTGHEQMTAVNTLIFSYHPCLVKEHTTMLSALGHPKTKQVCLILCNNEPFLFCTAREYQSVHGQLAYFNN